MIRAHSRNPLAAESSQEIMFFGPEVTSRTQGIRSMVVELDDPNALVCLVHEGTKGDKTHRR